MSSFGFMHRSPQGSIGSSVSAFAALSLLCFTALLASPSYPADDSPTGSTSTKTAQQIMDAARDSVVVIKQSGRDGAREGMGAGFVISEDGLIATSLHVIGEARPLTVTFADGKTRPVAEIHAWDRKLDLAVIRVDGKELRPLRLADSDNLKQGAPVVAIGNPQGLTHSIVQGVVSAIRDFEFGPMIQLAIPIEPGNSGGPLLDMKGRVHGILDMKSAVTDNLGFAIPINALKPLLDHPNSVPMEKWLAIGGLNEKLWKPLMGAQWRQKAGTITVDGAGAGFGGRSLCLSQKDVPEIPYEIAVTVRLDDEAGAAGLAFSSDGGDQHYGFYPSGGQLRLTRFDGPTVFTWNILRQLDSAHYQPGEWNRLKVRIEPDRILCFVNGHLATEVNETVARAGNAGLAKFRNTTAQFKNFQIGKRVDTENNSPSAEDAKREALRGQFEKSVSSADTLPSDLLKEPAATRKVLLDLAREWDQKAASARKAARELNQKSVEQELVRMFSVPESQIDLFGAALQIAKVETPDLDVQSYRDEINNMVQELQIKEQSGNREKLDRLRKYLFEENGFHGSRSDYYNRANSFMNRVLEDREGLPITLSVLFLQLGAQLGIEKLDGMPFPGHFMVRFINAEEEPLYIDVFDGGKLYRKPDLYNLISNHSEVPLLEQHFKPATKKDIIVRMLKNLVGLAQNSPARTLPYLDLLLALAPGEPMEHWRRASLRLQAGQRALAREDLQWLIENNPPGLDLERIEELYQSLR